MINTGKRRADLVKKALETKTRDLHACRLHLRSLEFEAAARERLC